MYHTDYDAVEIVAVCLFEVLEAINALGDECPIAGWQPMDFVVEAGTFSQ